MKTVTVTASKTYEVKIGSGLLANLAEEVKQVTKAKSFCVVSDSHVFPLYGDTVCNALKSAGFHCVNFVFPAGTIDTL